MAKWLSLILCFAISSVALSEDVLKVALPLPKGSKDSEMTQKMITHIFGKIGYSVQFTNLPIERCTQLVLSGEYDILPGKPRDEMEAFPGFPVVEEPYLEVPFYVYAKKNIPPQLSWKTLETFNCVSIIGIRLVDERMKNALKNGRLQRVASYTQALRMLEANRVDYAILIDRVADEVIKQEHFAGFFKSKHPVEITTIYILMSKKRADLAKKAAASLRKMKADGSYYKILKEFR